MIAVPLITLLFEDGPTFLLSLFHLDSRQLAQFGVFLRFQVLLHFLFNFERLLLLTRLLLFVCILFHLRNFQFMSIFFTLYRNCALLNLRVRHHLLEYVVFGRLNFSLDHHIWQSLPKVETLRPIITILILSFLWVWTLDSLGCSMIYAKNATRCPLVS